MGPQNWYASFLTASISGFGSFGLKRFVIRSCPRRMRLIDVILR
jgi:hypothetical protein